MGIETDPKRSLEEPEEVSNSSKKVRTGDTESSHVVDIVPVEPDNRKFKSVNRKLEGRKTHEAPTFTEEEIAAEQRRPKKKVAVLIGYSGTGYTGLQLMPGQRTIEGDLFAAFVSAGAISKANANDPKKSSLSRCARTDKGVHAAGNVITLKLIVEDADILSKINAQLNPQIRVWALTKVTAGFNCQAQCDSRWYEYLIPTFAFLPPHPSSWLGREILRIASEDGKLDQLNEAQKDVEGFWEQVDDQRIKPILESLVPTMRETVEAALYKTSTVSQEVIDKVGEALGDEAEEEEAEDGANNLLDDEAGEDEIIKKPTREGTEANDDNEDPELRKAIHQVKQAYILAKRGYRISESRLERVRQALAKYVGTHNFHNFTIRKSANDPSSNRFIRSFQVNGQPMIKNGIEWISLKVNGQSFMMHQIRKMVAMAALIVRCGTPLERIQETMTREIVNIPKAPSLGLLLERPVFDNYNRKAKLNEKDPILYDDYEKEILEFKKREIYDRMFREEEESHVFHTYFAQIDSFRENTFLFVSSRGLEACSSVRKSRTEDSSNKNKQTFRQDQRPRIIKNNEEENFIKDPDSSPKIEAI